ncbi:MULTISPECIES: PqiC family protein [Pseudomonas]|uniref:Membrane integrity-associated transporter subunit PqiC n=1 Tax=Pseudomonas quercus TaxID=2722792 RepID=A0ABX0YBQ0_9PSED|nr:MULTISPECIES: PqiC family protein [Pseudomonas]MBF7141172.1 membrane integrity-associated transporter subunit PqiC [Pseudomonas sp. LY10J]NJO99706.1 membrane integrity-associated transporter subunit PqiC [Pseudomonas quercus]
MNAKPLRALALVMPLALAACASEPTGYHTLLAPQAVPDRLPVAAPAYQFEMQQVRMPVQVDQPQLVVRQGQGSLAILENERWSGPLADEFHDALTQRLEQRLGTRDIAGLPRTPGVPVLSLRADVRRFDTVVGQYALVDVVWSLSLTDTTTKQRNHLTCSTLLQQPTTGGLNELVLAHQQLIDRLASTIAGTVSHWVTTPSSGCPSAAPGAA